ncbi:DUF835 domain-containing protein [Thermococcus henrietii]|uniref:DUF835 domain-containing protein n=1 Tax=Thermococcus henrietii TaxID=2016361 RepID=UPI000C06A039|nr:DUF835 domain-containing protein [Thermococcus henrietii]
MLKAFTPLLAGALVDKPGMGHFRIVHSLKEVPEEKAVVIGRAGARVPPGWELVTVSAARGFFGPRELHRILEGIVASLKSDPDKAVVIACPEYLALHNGFTAVVKFLNDVRDYAILLGGRVYLVTDELAWDPREFALLKRLED